MPLYAVTNADEITAACQRFAERLRDGAIRYDGLGIGWKGESRTADIYWQPTAHIWGFPVEQADRYWFGFGTGDPAPRNAVGDIVVQFGFIREGSDRRFGGLFARDEHNVLHLLHSGGIGGGRPGIGKNAFRAAYDGRFEEVNWIRPNARADYIDIATLEAPDLMERVATFVRAVQAFKDSVTAGR